MTSTFESKGIPQDTFGETSITVKSPIPENTPEIEEYLQDNTIQSSISKNEDESIPAALETLGEEEMKEEKKDVVLNLPI